MKTMCLAVVVLALCASGAAGSGRVPPPAEGVPAGVEVAAETPEQRDARMAWWREARFGMFIHWGLYAIPAGQWGEATHHAEWIRTSAQIPLEEYDRFQSEFNPVNFDARAWARMAREAGMGYIVITTKHHDGFCLWDSAVTEFDVMGTPFKRDIIRELADACRAEGLRIGFYHSIMDWHHPDYLPRREWETGRTAAGADFERFEAYLHAQVTELLTNYGPIGVMWFDGEWEATWSEERGRELYALCRRLQPDIIVNNRVGTGRDGMAGLTREGAFGGDFGTPEQEVPAEGLPGVDWESCMTMNDHWGYNAFDHRWKSSTELIRTLVDIASKGGNYLLNVGPRADGTFPPEAVDRLREIGVWMGRHHWAIHGTSASPFGSLEWGRCTVGKSRDGVDEQLTRLFLHVFHWPDNGRLEIAGLASEVVRARYVEDIGAYTRRLPPEDSRQGASVVLSRLTREAVDPHVSVIEMWVAKPIEVFGPPLIEVKADQFIDSMQVEMSDPRMAEGEPLDLRYTLDGSEPTLESPAYDGAIVVSRTTTVRVQAWRGETPVSPVASRTLTRVEPVAGVNVVNPQFGLLDRVQYEGSWSSMPRFEAMQVVKQDRSEGVTLEGRARDERFGAVFTGFIYVRAAGVYEFELFCDDGGRLFIADRLVVDNDGLHVAMGTRGTIALGEGFHPVRIEYFNAGGARALEVRGEMAGMEPRAIPARGFAIEGGE